MIAGEQGASDTAAVEPPASALVADLLALAARRVSPERAAAVAAFASAYARRIPDEVAKSLTAEELLGQVLGIFELADRRGTAPTAVRALNPTFAGDGYTSVGSVLETNCADSPFLVDSVSEAITGAGHEIRLVIHPIVGIERDAAGAIARVVHAREGLARESVMHFELSRHLDDTELGALATRVGAVLADVQTAVRDFAAMKERLGPMAAAATGGSARYGAEEIAEAVAFLEWLGDGNFVFLGYREYTLIDGKVSTTLGSGLGLLADDAVSRYATPVPLASIDPALRARLLGETLLVVSKTNRTSPVHRRARMDDITVISTGADGEATGALRLLGLFTRKAYMAPASRTPILARKLHQIAVAEDLLEGSHDHKVLVELFESFPKDELFAAGVDALRRTLVELLVVQEQRHVRLFVRPNLEERRVSVLVAVPRDRFGAELRQRVQALLVERYRGAGVDYHLALDRGDQAHMHFTIYVDGDVPDVPLVELERTIVELTRSWDDRLRERLVALYGEEGGSILAERYAAMLPGSYKAMTDIHLAVVDIEHFERLGDGTAFTVGLKNDRAVDQSLTRVGLYKTGGKARLSDILPILEHLGLTVIEEVSTRLAGAGGTYLHDVGVLGPDGRPLDLAACGDRVADCIAAVWRGDAETDSLNRLVVSAGLGWRHVQILRAYRTYRLRAGASFGLEYKNEAFAANPHIARMLVELFELRHDPSRPRDEAAEYRLATEIRQALDAVRSLDEDRILRAQLGLVEATVRTNAFRPGRRYLSFKLDSARVPDLPRPLPLWEIFVYSPEMEGIHLRGGRVARGGIRWSDRKEDYRTEILGLMKAQMVKNAVIVPVGSKGGFVLRQPPADRDALKAAVVEQYSTLIRGLLDLTDNLVVGEVVRPPDVRVLDAADPYLVVAADKGTATFSDVANAIAAEYAFWLGDAFASGGSAGYDHKELGITAKGAWESVERHFRELGVDIATTPFTVVGVGDMSGDVFGNGMLLSERVRLLAAFDHRHVFLDPDPDPAVSFGERRRLFALPGSSWDDYDRSLVSTGGGVWARSEKRIPISPEARRALGIEADALAPNDLLAAVLRAPADLLWNGGIGTFVKASSETNADAGDRTNDAIRVDASTVRARVVGEGGNLGFTQRARIEYALAGGRINADFIDNSAGVDCSDHEVNLKILLGLAVAAGDLTLRQRDELLRAVEQDVATLVLYDNYLQAQILSQEEVASAARIEEYEDLMAQLEAGGLLDRAIEFLPASEEMADRRRSGRGLARPELCVLLAYAKRSLKEALAGSAVLDEPVLARELAGYFPARVVERFGSFVEAHPLRRELLATIVANDVVNSQGITFASRLALETGADAGAVSRAFWIAREASGAVARWADVEALDGHLEPVAQNRLMVEVDSLVETLARWFLLNAPAAPVAETVAELAPVVAELDAALGRCGSAGWQARRSAAAAALEHEGVPPELARRHAFQGELAHAPDILAVSRATSRTIEEVATAFFLTGERTHLDLLEERLAALETPTRFDRWAANAVEDDLLALRREIAQRALAGGDGLGPGGALESYLASREDGEARLDRLVESLATQAETTLAGLTVALRQVRALAV